MNKLKKLFLGLLLIPAAFTISCNKTENTAPTMEVSPSSAVSAKAGDNVTYVITINAQSGATLKTLSVTDNNSVKVLDSTFGSSVSSVNSYGYIYTVPASAT